MNKNNKLRLVEYINNEESEKKYIERGHEAPILHFAPICEVYKLKPFKMF